MRREARAYLADVLESCDAIAAATAGMELEAYKANRLVRSSVEREFTIIGEAIAALGHSAPDVFASITKARRIVDFRNQLTTSTRQSATRSSGASSSATFWCFARSVRPW